MEEGNNPVEKSESFVFYRSFHEAGKLLPVEQYGEYMMAVNEYALNGIIPEFTTPMCEAMFILTKPQIDANVRRRQNSRKGGRPRKPMVFNSDENTKPMVSENAQNKKPMVFNSDENTKPMVSENAQNKKPMVFNSDENTKPMVSNCVAEKKPNENVNVNVNVNENENVTEVSLSLSQEYSDKVFQVFSENNLPCANNNSITFLQRDFKNGIAYLHSNPETEHLHSDEVIQACRNYAEVFKDPHCYIKNAYGFERFVKLKNFSDFLPANYRKQNFKRYDEQNEEPEPMKPSVNMFKKLNAPEKCRFCGNELEEASASPYTVRCVSCRSWAEYDPITRKWEWEEVRTG